MTADVVKAVVLVLVFLATPTGPRAAHAVDAGVTILIGR